LCLLLAVSLTVRLSLSLWILAGLVVSSISTYLAVKLVTEKVMGQDRLIYYHHMIAVMLVAAVVLWLVRQPILPYLDVAILGLGTLLACGRLGCFMVGCCHGRPSGWGVCYREEHRDVGFTPYFVGVRLFPIQGVESLWVSGIVVVGTALILSDHPSGEILAWYVIAYAVGRFCFEFMRGDPARPYLGGFSEAQWTSLVLMCLIVWAEISSILTFHLWHAVATACLVCAMIAVGLVRHFRRTAKHLLLHPRHVDEVARAVEWVTNFATEEPALSKRCSTPAVIKVGCTSLGIQISASAIKQAGSGIYHYALSSQTGTMTKGTARTLAGLILQLKHPSGSTEFIEGNQGVFHLLIHP
jgi:hypothetical protein